VNPKQWNITEFDIPKAWLVTKGAGIKVAILDTGVDANHIDLRNNIAAAVDMTSEHTPIDGNGHGTFVAGEICAYNAKGTGVWGVAPAAKLYSCKVLMSNGSGSFDSIVKGILWAISQKVDIISMSLGASAPYEPIHQALIRANAAGIILIAAAGNDGQLNAGDDIGYPARYNEVIAVGSIDESKQPSQYSSSGAELDIMCPGRQIFSTWPNNKYAILSGTSMAAPYCSALCALILAKHRANPNSATPIRNTADMLAHLKKSAIDVGVPGWDANTGFGWVDPESIFKSI
jgi:subtilisin